MNVKSGDILCNDSAGKCYNLDATYSSLLCQLSELPCISLQQQIVER